MIRRIPLETPITEGASNAYLLDEGPVTLVDTGIGTAQAWAQLEDALAGHGVSLADIDRVFVTHYHADHGGLVGEVQSASGATVFAHEADADRVTFTEAEWLALCEPQYERLRRWGVPDDELAAVRAVNDANHAIYSDSATVEPVTDGETFDAGAGELEVVHTPGHTKGSCCYRLGDTGVFTGDTLLPVYTPNIGGVDMRLDDPLGSYLDSLALLDDRVDGRAFPGHRAEIDRPHRRLRRIVAHHERQARRVLGILDRRHGPADVWSVAAELFERLEGIHIMLASGETHAHLENMRGLGLLERRPGGYVLSAGSVEALGDRLADGWPLLER